MTPKQFAYTGPTPAQGYVGFVNFREIDTDQICFSVRSEPSGTLAEYTIPRAEALKLFYAAFNGFQIEQTGNSTDAVFDRLETKYSQQVIDEQPSFEF